MSSFPPVTICPFDAASPPNNALEEDHTHLIHMYQGPFHQDSQSPINMVAPFLDMNLPPFPGEYASTYLPSQPYVSVPTNIPAWNAFDNDPIINANSSTYQPPKYPMQTTAAMPPPKKRQQKKHACKACGKLFDRSRMHIRTTTKSHTIAGESAVISLGM